MRYEDVDWTRAQCALDAVPVEVMYPDGASTGRLPADPVEAEKRLQSCQDAMEREAAERVCSRCAVRSDCLEFALASWQQGVWGGKSEKERRSIRRQRNKGSRRHYRKAPTAA